jgi:hypothetical protein
LDDEEIEAYDSNMNQLSEICQYVVNSKIENSKIHLTTATFFRGDRMKIFATEARNEFVFYHLDWVEHWESLGIENFEFEYGEYDGLNPIKEVISNIKIEPDEKHLIIIPPLGNKWRRGKGDFDKLLLELKEQCPNLRVLDLVTKKTQKKNKSLLAQEPESAKDGESKFDVIVACRLFDEGTDWAPCSRIHITYCVGSITLAVQVLGRIFRMYNNKTTIKSISYLKTLNFSEVDEENSRELISDRTNAILIALQIDEMTSPIFIELPDVSKKSAKRSLTECFKNDLNDVFESLVEEYEKLDDDKKTNQKSLHSLAEKVANEYGISENNVESVAEGLVVKLLRSTNSVLMEMNIDVAEYRRLGFDLIMKKYKLNKSILHGDCSKEEAKKLKELFLKNEDLRQKEWDDFVEDARTIETWDKVRSKYIGTYSYNQLLKDRIKIRREKDLSMNLKELESAPWWDEFINEGIFVSLEEAQKITRAAGIISQSQYQKWEDRPKNLPSNPQQSYKEWTNWYDFLGVEKVEFLSYEEAIQYLRENNITSRPAYRKCKSKNLPSNPDIFYKEWTGWSDFFGRKKTQFASYKEALELIQKYKISSSREYQAARLEVNIIVDGQMKFLPSKPHLKYKQWPGWDNFLEKGREQCQH